MLAIASVWLKVFTVFIGKKLFRILKSGSVYFEVKTLIEAATERPPKEMFRWDLIYCGDLNSELLIVHYSNGWLFRP